MFLISSSILNVIIRAIITNQSVSFWNDPVTINDQALYPMEGVRTHSNCYFLIFLSSCLKHVDGFKFQINKCLSHFQLLNQLFGNQGFKFELPQCDCINPLMSPWLLHIHAIKCRHIDSQEPWCNITLFINYIVSRQTGPRSERNHIIVTIMTHYDCTSSLRCVSACVCVYVLNFTK